MSKKQYNKPETIVETNTPVVFTEERVSEPEPPAEPVYGVVFNCEKLNVRNAPSKESEVVCKIDKDTECMIDLDTSTSDWLHVYLADGIEGFCMKDYVKVK